MLAHKPCIPVQISSVTANAATLTSTRRRLMTCVFAYGWNERSYCHCFNDKNKPEHKERSAAWLRSDCSLYQIYLFLFGHCIKQSAFIPCFFIDILQNFLLRLVLGILDGISQRQGQDCHIGRHIAEIAAHGAEHTAD